MIASWFSLQSWIHPYVLDWIQPKILSFLSQIYWFCSLYRYVIQPFADKYLCFYRCTDLISFLSENTQQKGGEEQEEHPEDHREHLRRRTIQLSKRRWAENCWHSLVMQNNLKKYIKIHLPSNVQGSFLLLSQERSGWGEKETNSLRNDKYFGKGKRFQRAYFPCEENSGDIRWCSEEWNSIHWGTDVLFAYEALCLVSTDCSIFAKLKPRCPSSPLVMSDERLNSLDWKRNLGQSACALTSDFPQLRKCRYYT